MTMRIKIFADYVNPDKAKELFEQAHRAVDFPDEYGPDKKVYFVGSEEEATHALVINCVKPDLSGMSKWNVVGLAHEPAPFLPLSLDFIRYACSNIGIYYIGDVGDLPSPFTEGQGYLLHADAGAGADATKSKKKLMSLMISQKQFASGHKYRHELATAILKTDLPIDIYGRGCKLYGQDSRLRGEFTNPEPMLKDYRFHICIENFVSNYYFSEKVVDPVCYGVTPVYMGCRNIEEFLPDMTIKLTGILSHDMDIIRKICQEPDKYELNAKIKENLKGKAKFNLIREILDGNVFP